MESDIKVSIVMPVFNHEKYVAHAIESVLMQKVNFKYELLIGEDCSTDGSREIINRYKDREGVKFFPRESNMHKLKINNALDLDLRTQGEYMIILEGDDYWTDPDKLQKQVDFLDAHPDYVMCAHRFEVVDQDDKVYKDQDFECQFSQDNPYDLQTFESGLMLSHLNSMLFRNFFKEKEPDDISLFSDFPWMGGDYLLTARLILTGKCHCIPEVMSHYRKVVSKSSSSFSSRMESNNTRDKQFQCILDSEKLMQKRYNVSFEARKKSAYASTVFKWYREHNKKNFKVVTNVIKMSGQPLKYSWWFLYLISARFIKNHTGKRGERVRF